MARPDLEPNIGGGSTGNEPAVKGQGGGGGGAEYPAISSMVEFGLNAATDYFNWKTQRAEADRQSAVAQTEYWTKYAAQSAKNYRDFDIQLRSWYREAEYVENVRQYEQDQAKQQAVFKGEVATAATKNFEKQLGDLEGRFYEEEAKEIIELESIRINNIAQKAKAVAGGQVGRTVVGLQAAKNQQWLSNLSNRQITREFRLADKIRAAEAQDVARQNTINQVRYYTPQPVADPVKPLAPLPIQTVEPTPVKGPSATNLAISLVKQGATSYLNYKDMQPPKRPEAAKPQSEYDEASA